MFNIQRDKNDKAYACDYGGYPLCIEEAKELIQLLTEYIKENTAEDIELAQLEFLEERGQGQYRTYPKYTITGNVPKRAKLGGYVYLVHSAKLKSYKIGMSVNPASRFKGVCRENETDIEVIHTHAVNYMELCEQELHSLFESKRVKPAGEWFYLNEQDVEQFKQWREL